MTILQKDNQQALKYTESVVVSVLKNVLVDDISDSESLFSTSSSIVKRTYESFRKTEGDIYPIKPKREDAVRNIRYKTEPCQYFKNYKACPNGTDCHFAHGYDELHRPALHPKFKTQVCEHFKSGGHCPYGDGCFFLHSK